MSDKTWRGLCKSLGISPGPTAQERDAIFQKAQECAMAYREKPSHRRWLRLWDASLSVAAGVAWRVWLHRASDGRALETPADALNEIYLVGRSFADSWDGEKGHWFGWFAAKSRFALLDLIRAEVGRSPESSPPRVSFCDFQEFEKASDPRSLEPFAAIEARDSADLIVSVLECHDARAADVMVRFAVGERQRDIGVRHGICESRVSQIVRLSYRRLKESPRIQKERVGEPHRPRYRRTKREMEMACE